MATVSSPLRKRRGAGGEVLGAWAVGTALLAGGCRDAPKQEEAQPDTPPAAQPSPLRDATAAFFDDATAGRWSAAYARTAAAYREWVPLEAFAAAMAHNPWFRQGAHFETPGGSNEYPRRVARLEGWTVAPASMAWTTVFFGFEEDHWAITGMNVGGAPGLPSPPPARETHEPGRR
jgi:hypothetical protein